MKRVLPLIAALAMCLSMASAAMAGPSEDLRGEWIIESMFGEAPPPGVEMRMEFVDGDTVKMTMIAGGQEQMSEEGSYTVTEDTLTITMDGDEDVLNWEIDDDGKLHITSTEDDGPAIILHRPE